MIAKNYIEAAKKNEYVFRLILDKHVKHHKGLTVEQIHEKYSKGKRFGIWTILDFQEVSPNIFMFSSENIAVLSGGGSSEKYTMEEGELKRIGSGMRWMS